MFYILWIQKSSIVWSVFSTLACKSAPAQQCIHRDKGSFVDFSNATRNNCSGQLDSCPTNQR